MFVALAACSADSVTSNPSVADLKPARSISVTGTPAPGTVLRFVSRMSSSLCLEVAGGGDNLRGAIQTAACSDAAAQQFTYVAGNALQTSGGLCVDVYMARGNDGDPIVAYTCNGGTNQQWTISDRGQIVGMRGKCLDIPGARTALGTAMILWSCHGDSNQRWDVQAVAEPSAPAPTTPAPVAPAPAPPAPTESAPAVRIGKYVAPNGTSGGSGTIDSPLDLRTALGGGRVSPGDTVWVRGGTYRGDFVNSLNGTSAARITVRAVPGERATIDGHLIVLGSNVTFWGIEVMSSTPTSSGALGINVKAPGSRFVNMIVHDESASGLGVWTEAPDAEVYGSLVYNNGTHPNLDHGIYAQGNAGLKRIHDNVIFNNWTYGLHIYTGSGGYIRNFDVQGNTAFNNGTTGPYLTASDLFIGGEVAADNITFAENNTFRNARDMSMSMGYAGTQHGSLVLRDNYVVGGFEIFSWSPVSNTGTTVIRGTPTGPARVVVRPNRYEAGRAHVTVYNWANQGSVSANLAGRAGRRRPLRGAQRPRLLRDAGRHGHLRRQHGDDPDHGDDAAGPDRSRVEPRAEHRHAVQRVRGATRRYLKASGGGGVRAHARHAATWRARERRPPRSAILA